MIDQRGRHELWLNHLATEALSVSATFVLEQDQEGRAVIRAAQPADTQAVVLKAASSDRSRLPIPDRFARLALTTATQVLPDFALVTAGDGIFHLEHLDDANAERDYAFARLTCPSWRGLDLPRRTIQRPVRDTLRNALRRRMTATELAAATGLTRAALWWHLDAMTNLPLPPNDRGRSRADVDRWLDLRTGDVFYRRSDVHVPIRRRAPDEIVLLHPRLILTEATAAARAAHVLDLLHGQDLDLAALQELSPMPPKHVAQTVRCLRTSGWISGDDRLAALGDGQRYIRRIVNVATHGILPGHDDEDLDLLLAAEHGDIRSHAR